MLKNYIKIGLRNLWKNKLISFINILGLTLGITGAGLLLLNVHYDLSVDQFHEKKSNIYKVYNREVVNSNVECWSNTAAPLAPALKTDYPEVKNVTRISGTEKLWSYGEKKLKVQGSFADPAFLSMFSFPLLKGNAQTALKDVYSIVVTEEFAKKVFGSEDPMGKIIRADNKDNFTVTGVLKTLPNNTDFRFEYLLPWEFLTVKGIEHPVWDYNYLSTFVELQPEANIDAINKKIADVIIRRSNKEVKAEVFLHPLVKEHLYHNFENGKAKGGENIYFLVILATVILSIACINFMNLSTARSEKRAREVGVRKVMGAAKGSLIGQFMGESILTSLFAGVLALVLITALLPGFSTFAKVRLEMPFDSPLFWLTAVGFVLLTGLLAGSYPAFYLSSFKPVMVLKGVLKNGKALVTPRKILVVAQFVISIFLINFTIVFRKQINHAQNREIGFVKENLLFHPLTSDLRKNYDPLKQELINTGIASSVCQSNTPITRSMGNVTGLEWQGQDKTANVRFELVSTSGDFVKTNGLRLISGRDIDLNNFPADTASCLINETAAKVLGFKEPLGQTIKNGDNFKIVGVLKDFLIGAPVQAMNPMLVQGDRGGNYISVRLNDHSSVQNIKTAEAIFKKYNPGFLTELQFADVDYAFKFTQAKNAAILISSFALIAIFISAMGLFGLTIYMAENRIREIGIRKVLGATVAGITTLLAKDFLKLVMIAILIASPLAWWFMKFFLRQFEYRTNLSWWILVAAAIAVLLIALFTISFRSIKAALSNPVKSLRTE
jgi:ABC-type antimicrobial peptide transport system permease subunit